METKTPWLLSDEDFALIANTKQFNEFGLFILWDNGITCPDDANFKLHLARFTSDNLDCSFCGNMDKHYVLKTDQWKCKKCHRTFSTTSGTYLDNSKLEAHIWWRFCYLVGKMKITNSSVISQDLGVTQKTAWYMLDTLRTARKQTSDTKFVNGAEVLVFETIHDVLDVLIKIRRDKNNTIPDKDKILKKIYNLIVSNQTAIPFKELEYFTPLKASVYKSMHLQFRHRDVYIEIKKKTRIKPFRNEGLVGEEKYLLCTPLHKKTNDVIRLYNSLLKKIPEPVAVLSPSTPNFEEPIALPVESTSIAYLEPVESMIESTPTIPKNELSVPHGITVKKCRRKECNEVKSISEFHISNNSKDGLQSYCKQCIKLAGEEFRRKLQQRMDRIKADRLANSPPEIPITPPREINKDIEKQCRRKTCLQIKPLSEFNKGRNADGYSSYCKECCRAIATAYSLKRSEESKLRKLSFILNIPIPPTPVIPVPVKEKPDITEKQCIRKDCMKVKHISEFHKSRNKNGYHSYCKECSNKIAAESNQRRRKKNDDPESSKTVYAPIIDAAVEKQCTNPSCLKIKPLTEFSMIQGTDKHQSWCKQCTTDKSHEKRPISAKRLAEELEKKKNREEFNRSQLRSFLNLDKR